MTAEFDRSAARARCDAAWTCYRKLEEDRTKDDRDALISLRIHALTDLTAALDAIDALEAERENYRAAMTVHAQLIHDLSVALGPDGGWGIPTSGFAPKVAEMRSAIDAVLALHEPTTDGNCGYCLRDMEWEEPIMFRYPCPTAAALGVSE